MRLSINNIGRLGSTSIEIEGITVIAGENKTGKSTVSRVLYGVFNSFYNFQRRIAAERIDSIGRMLFNMNRRMTKRIPHRINCWKISENIVSNINNL